MHAANVEEGRFDLRRVRSVIVVVSIAVVAAGVVVVSVCSSATRCASRQPLQQKTPSTSSAVTRSSVGASQ